MIKQYSKHTRAGVSALFFGFATWLSVLGLLLTSKPPNHNFAKGPVSYGLQSQLNNLPLSFEENRGQTDQSARFIARQRGYTLYLTNTEVRFELKQKSPNKPKSLNIKLGSKTSQTPLEGLERLNGKTNYFIGNDSSEWQTDVPTFSRVRQRGVYPGIDAVFYGSRQQLEYDFIVAPQADPQQIELAFEGSDKLEINEHGNLIIDLGGEQLQMHKPVIYQQINGQRRFVEGSFSIRSICNPQSVGFELDDYDHNLPLVIDPVVDYSTYFGGSGTDIGYGIAVDRLGFIYITGQTGSLNYPTKNAYQSTRDGATDAFVTKLDPKNSTVVFSTYFGGRNPGDRGSAIAVDMAGNIYLTGETNSLNFPTANAANPIFRGNVDAFVTKFNIEGNVLLYSTFLGGTFSDIGFGIAVDRFDNAYITGRTLSANFATKNPMQATLNGQQDVFVAKFSPDGAVIYSTYLGGELSQTTGRDEEAGYGIAVDALQNAYITGFTTSPGFPTVGAIQPDFAGVEDAFVAKINAAGSALVYSTFLGGDRAEEARAVALDPIGNAYITGYTFSLNFPIVNALQRTYGGSVDAFVTKINATGSAIIYSTFLGGSGTENTGLVADITPVGGIAVDILGNAYITGKTESQNFPVVRALQPTLRGNNDAFIAKIDPAGSELIYSTYLGSTFTDNNGFDERGLDIAVDSSGSVYVTGQVLKNDFPTVMPAQADYGGGLSDAFVVKISAPDIVTTATVSAASFTSGSVAPEEIVATFGANLASGTEIASTTPLPTSLLGTSVKVKDHLNVELPAPLFFVSPGQINFQIPPGLATGKATITVTNAQNMTVGATVLIEKTAPGLFSANASGKEVAAAILLRVKLDGTQIFEPVAQFDSVKNKFVPLPIDFEPGAGNAGDQLFLLLFGSGWKGRSAPEKVTVQIGGLNIPVLYAGAQGSFVGEDQINLQLPRALAGRGQQDIFLMVDGQLANSVTVTFK
ncbi:MAG: SBBP repeat-containing protein [Acidobacteria bacterium]|nr:SBBP repeat-containing protein [Acidobacteriota bacterium]